MAEVSKPGSVSPATTTPSPNSRIGGLLAGEDIGQGDALYIDTDGTVKRASGAAADKKAECRGFAPAAAATGEPVSIYRGMNFGYATSVDPGSNLYLSATVPGGLSDTATTGGTTPVAFVVDKDRIHVLP